MTWLLATWGKLRRSLALSPAARARATFQLALAISLLTFILLILGGIVWSTGSALACPDWPLCYGQLFPVMEGQILFEHGHRLVAGSVASLTVALAVLSFRAAVPGGQAPLRWLSIGAVALVLSQAVLGGLTVLLRLPLLVRVLHLATSQAFFATSLWLTVRAWKLTRPAAASVPLSASVRRGLTLAAAAIYLQLLLGALVRHTGSGLACPSVLLCGGRAWPAFGPGQLQMLHRYWALLAGGLLIWATVRALPELRRLPQPLARRLVHGSHALLLVQVGLGAASVQSFLSVPIVTAHLATGALLWGTLVALLSLTAAPRLAPAGELSSGPRFSSGFGPARAVLR